MTRMAILLSAVLLSAVLALAGCSAGEDAAVAVVNDEEIGSSELQARMDQVLPAYEAQGIELNEEAIGELELQELDNLITQRVLLQEAVSGGFVPDGAEIESEYEQIAGQFEDEAQFDEALSAQGFSPETLREALGDDLAVQGYLEAELADVEFAVTDAEVEALYEEYSSTTEDMPPLEEVRDLLITELEGQQQGDLVAQLVEDLKQASDIQVLL